MVWATAMAGSTGHHDAERYSISVATPLVTVIAVAVAAYYSFMGKVVRPRGLGQLPSHLRAKQLGTKISGTARRKQ